MDKLNLFIPLCKVNESTREVSGLLSCESVDKSGEIMDYDSGKAEFEKWSKEAHKRSGGKSLGNVREMHDNKACGKLTELTFDDATKSVNGTAKIVDDAAWAKVIEGVYTGFSIGGEYAKKWDDPENAGVKRFTPVLAEVSIVDNPCVAEAVFELTRADGSTEMRKFKQTDPRNDKSLPLNKRYAGVTPPEQSQQWLAKDGKAFSTKEEAFAHNATLEDPAFALLNKMHETLDKLEAQPDPMTLGKKDFSDDRRKELATQGKALPDGSFPIEDKDDLHNAVQAYGRASDKPKAKAHIIEQAKALNATDALPANWHKDGKADAQEETEKSFKGCKIKKGLMTVARSAALLQELEWLCSEVEWEEAAEGDDSNSPDALKHIITTLCTWLKDACEEECDEIAEPHAADLMTLAITLPEDHAKAMAKVIGNLRPIEDAKELEKPEVKARVQKLIEFKKALEKAGARHSKADMEALGKLQSKHDEMEGHMDKMHKALGEVEDAHDDIHSTHRAMGKCFGKSADGNMDKIKEQHGEMAGQIKKAMAAHGEAEDIHGDMEDTHEEMGKCMDGLMSSEKAVNATLQKTVTDETALLKADNEKQKETINKLTEGLGSALKRIETIEKQPAAAKGVLYAVPKGHEHSSGEVRDETPAGEPDRPMIGRL